MIRFGFLLGALLLVAGACGSDGDDVDATATQSTESPQATITAGAEPETATAAATATSVPLTGTGSVSVDRNTFTLEITECLLPEEEMGVFGITAGTPEGHRFVLIGLKGFATVTFQLANNGTLYQMLGDTVELSDSGITYEGSAIRTGDSATVPISLEITCNS